MNGRWLAPVGRALCLIALVLAGAVAQAQSPVMPGARPAIVPAGSLPNSGVDPNDDRLGPGDVITVSVLSADTLNRKVRVDSGGRIALPLVGNIQVAGLSPREVEQIIADVLREKYMNDPQVGVFVEESASMRFSIEGAVKLPSIYHVKGRTTLLQAIAAGGGFTNLADTADVKLIRGTGAEQKILVFNAEEIKAGKVADPVILANDVIVATPSTGRTLLFDTLNAVRGFFTLGTLR